MAENDFASGGSQEPDRDPDAASNRRAAERSAVATTALRTARVGDLRVRGGSFRGIALELGISVSTAHDDWRRFLAENKPPEETTEEYRGIQQARYEERLVSTRKLRERIAGANPASIPDFTRLIAVENECERGLERLLGTPRPIVMRVEGTVGVEIDGSLQITAADWARAVELKRLQDEVAKLLPAAFDDVIEAELVATVASGNGNGHE